MWRDGLRWYARCVARTRKDGEAFWVGMLKGEHAGGRYEHGSSTSTIESVINSLPNNELFSSSHQLVQIQSFLNKPTHQSRSSAGSSYSLTDPSLHASPFSSSQPCR